MTKRVAVALSGGVDSAVTALLLKQQGYDVVGLTAKMTCDDNAQNVVENAKKVADCLGIQHFALDVSKEFEKEIIEYFKNSYENGETPNPCMMCNKLIKWGILFDYAINTLGADFVATGHYANIKEMDGYYKLYPASDEHKDQLYFLFLLSQKKLSKTLFPLNSYKKSEVKELAIKYNLPPKSSKESQDICFIKPPMTIKKFLASFLQEKQGNFIEKRTGKILGKHDGFWQYTIGQRKGIGLAAPEALYVVGIEPQSNTVYVGYKNELFIDKLKLNNICWSYPQTKTEFEAFVKIRYNMDFVKSKIVVVDDGVYIYFSEPVSALTKGQACVIYDVKDKHLLGGGII